MTEAEALDEAAKAAGWPNGWGEASRFAPNNLFNAIRAHAATLMENAALKAENERLNAILSEMNDTDVIAKTMAENERLRNAMAVMDNTVRELEAARPQGWDEAIEAAAEELENRARESLNGHVLYGGALAIRALTKENSYGER